MFKFAKLSKGAKGEKKVALSNSCVTSPILFLLGTADAKHLSAASSAHL